MRVTALVCSHNRIKVTRAFIESLGKANIPERLVFELYCLDDGSIDGTGKFLREAVGADRVVIGSGQEYWAGGMRMLWEKISDSRLASSFTDWLMVFNDDVVLDEDCFIRILAHLDFYKLEPRNALAIALNVRMPNSEKVSYGGLRNLARVGGFYFKPVHTCQGVEHADTLNMNFALISAKALELVGFLDPVFTHHRADIDFGLRLRQAGGSVLVLPGSFGECDPVRYDQLSIKTDPGSLLDRFRKVLHPKNDPIKERFVFYRRHAGRLWIFYFLYAYVAIVAPVLRKASFLKRFKKNL